MAKSQHVCLDEVVAYFDELEDPRSTINQKHPLVSVVVIAMMAVLAGAGGPTAQVSGSTPKGFLYDQRGPLRRDAIRNNRTKSTFSFAGVKAGKYTLCLWPPDPGVMLDDMELRAK